MNPTAEPLESPHQPSAATTVVRLPLDSNFKGHLNVERGNTWRSLLEPVSAAPHTMESENIDRLLERYLALLDEYTTLRESLSKSQASLYQLLARANFSAERGMRYGPDYYDDRMQAVRLLSIASGDEGCPRFETVHAPEDRAEEGEQPTAGEGASEETKEEPKEEKPAEKESKPKSRDPLRWYGIFSPLPLRQAQSQAVNTVEGIIPKLVTVDAEMKDVEIQIRRARKRRAKAEAAKDKDKVTETISPATAVEAS